MVRAAMRILFSLLFLFSALSCGFFEVPLWCVPLLAVPFTVGYIHGKWLLWRPLLQNRGKRFYQSLLATYLIQSVVVLILYLIGRGIGSLMGIVAVR